MTELSAKPNQTFMWRCRYINEHRAYSIDLDRQAFTNFLNTLPDKGWPTVFRAIVVDFALRSAYKTPIQDFFAKNVDAEWCMAVFGAKGREEPNKFKVEPAVRGIRKLSIKPNAQFSLIYPNTSVERGFNVLVLQVPFQNKNGDVLNEFIIVGIAKRIEDTVSFGSLTINRDISQTSESDIAALRRNLFRLQPFGEENIPLENDTAFDERVLSFCVRWHICRHGKRTNSLFDQVVGAAQVEETDAQLFHKTVRYFTSGAASDEIFSNRQFLKKLFFLWQNNCVPLHTRIWMSNQIVAAVEYYIDHHVVNQNMAKRYLFVRETMLSAFAYFMPQLVVYETTPLETVIDFCSPAVCALQFRFNTFIDKQKINEAAGERRVYVEAGRQHIPNSAICRLFVPMLKAALEQISTTVSISPGAEPQWLVDETVVPIQGTDFYSSSRTIRYDDFPVDGYLYRRLNMTPAIASASHGRNLAEEFAMTRNQEEIEIRKSQSIPIRRSTTSLSVSRESLHSICSISSMPAIEEIGSIIEQNACLKLHKNYAIPMCARQRTFDYVDTASEYNGYEDRNFTYRFFASLDLEEVNHNTIAEFMLVHTPKDRNHKDEIKRFPMSLAKMRAGQAAERQQKYGETPEQAESKVSLMSCRGNCDKKFCPYAATASGVAGADEELARNLKKLSPLLRNDDAAVAKIVEQTKKSGFAQRGCMQEFIETRKKLNISFEENTDITFYQPRHYVYACAQSLK